MAKFTVTITTDNDAFAGDDLAGEITYILRNIEAKLEHGGIAHGRYFTTPLRDSNGNTVGKYAFIK